MLSKLIKHEFRATGRIMLPLYAATLLVSILGNFAIRILDKADGILVNTTCGIILFLFGVGVIAVCLMSFLIMITRFCRNLMGDEGYLMFTLPTTSRKLIFSKIIVSVVWFAASLLVDAVAVLMLVFRVDMLDNFFSGLRDLFEHFFALPQNYIMHGSLFCVEALVLCVVSSAATCLIIYASITTGHSFAKNKGLMSFVSYFAFHTVLQFVSIPFLNIFGNNFDEILASMNDLSAVHTVLLLSILASLVICAIFYFITSYMMHRKLNLQ